MTVLFVAAVVYVGGVLHLVEAAIRLRPFERPADWRSTALGWPVWAVGGAVLTARAKVGMVLRLVDEGGGPG